MRPVDGQPTEVELEDIREVSCQGFARPFLQEDYVSGLNQDPLAAGREQKVEAVLVGNVQKAGNTLRITVQLLNVEDGRSLWSTNST